MQKSPIETGEKKRLRTLNSVLKFAVCIVSLFIIGAFQTSFFKATGFLSVAPDMLLAMVAAVSLFEGEKSGALCGLTAGLITISLGGNGTTFMPVFYFFVGYVLGLMGKTLFRRNLVSWTVYAAPVSIIRSAISFFYLSVMQKELGLKTILTRFVLPELILTFVFSYLCYLLVKLILRPFRQRIVKDDALQL